jgi:hypothetical protein
VSGGEFFLSKTPRTGCRLFRPQPGIDIQHIPVITRVILSEPQEQRFWAAVLDVHIPQG